MKVTPQITADFEDYPELAPLIDQAIRRVVELMEIHDISEIRRVHKTGVFDRPYTKDVVTPLGVATLPNTVSAVRYAAGKAILDYLETIGISGIGISMTSEEIANVAALWVQRASSPAQSQQASGENASLEPEPASEVPDTQDDAAKPQTPAEASKSVSEKQPNSKQPSAAESEPTKTKEN